MYLALCHLHCIQCCIRGKDGTHNFPGCSANCCDMMAAVHITDDGSIPSTPSQKKDTGKQFARKLFCTKIIYNCTNMCFPSKYPGVEVILLRPGPHLTLWCLND
jgi:hypothetical protein